jgi:hypothetical protein
MTALLAKPSYAVLATADGQRSDLFFGQSAGQGLIVSGIMRALHHFVLSR